MKILDKKVVLAILIVALIGVVAATYNINDAGKLFNPLASVNDGSTNTIDLLSSGEEGVANDTVATSGNSQSPSSNSSSAQAVSTSSNPNSQSQPTTVNTNNQNNANKPVINNANNSTPNNKLISKAKGKQIAENSLRGGDYDGATAVYHSTIGSGDNICYVYVIIYHGETVGEYEINAYTGVISGGAFANEVQPPEETNNSSV